MVPTREALVWAAQQQKTITIANMDPLGLNHFEFDVLMVWNAQRPDANLDTLWLKCLEFNVSIRPTLEAHS